MDGLLMLSLTFSEDYRSIACNGSRLEAVANFGKNKFSITTEFLAKDKRDLTTYFAIAFKPMLADVVVFKTKFYEKNRQRINI